MIKGFLSFLVAICVLSATARAEAVGKSGHQKWARKLSSQTTDPCADDMERIKGVAAISFSENEIDTNHHKLSVSKNDLGDDGVFTTAANDAAVVNFSGTVDYPGQPGMKFALKASALCSPNTKKYELMQTTWNSVANSQ
jgi:hypothetical protein